MSKNKNIKRNISGSVLDKAIDISAGVHTRSATGVSGMIHQEYGVGGAAAVRGQIGLINDSQHQAVAWAQHQRSLDKNLSITGPPTNSVGIDYKHAGGTTAFVTGSKTAGFPATGAVGAHVPIVTSNNGNTTFGVSGQSTFGGGMKPNHSAAIVFKQKF